MFAEPNDDPSHRVAELEFRFMVLVDELKQRSQTQDSVWMDYAVVCLAISKLYETKANLRERMGH